MNGYNNNQWQQQHAYENNPSQDFYGQLQQHAAPQQTYGANNGYPAYRHPVPQQYPVPRVQVVIPSRPPQYQNYHQIPTQPSYQAQQYNQSYPPQQVHYQQNYHQSSQLDGATTFSPMMPVPQQITTQSPLQPVENGVHKSTPAKPAGPPTPPSEPDHNYAQVLLVLADEYMTAAGKVDQDSEEYYKLISFCLGCMESALKNYQLSPLREAQISLTYARLLYENTENFDEAEKALTKAIETCEQNKYLDLKYALILLSIRILHQNKPRAALKALSGHIEEMEAYKHVAWLYVFYYEAASLSLTPSSRDLHHAISQLEKLEQLAARYHDNAVVALAAIVSALIHLQTSHTDAVSSAQQAIARNRSLQLDPNVSSLPQVQIVTELVDLACSMRGANPQEGDAKRIQVQEGWAQVVEHPAWDDRGLLYVPISAASLREKSLQTGGLVVKHNGGLALPFSWFTREDTEQLCFLFCTTSKAHKNSSDGFKSGKFCLQGLELISKAKSLSSGLDQRVLQCRFHIEHAFLSCMRSEWPQASSSVVKAVKLIQQQQQVYPKTILVAIHYLRGVIYQGTGQLDKALAIWKHAHLEPSQWLRQADSNTSTNNPPQIQRCSDHETTILHNFSILTLINRLFIIDTPSHPEHATKDHLLTLLHAFSTSITSPILDRNISTACTLAHSLLTNSGIWVSKDRLIRALNEAKAINNQQLTALTLALMQQAFFLGATDQHAQQCVKAASVQVKSWRHATWLHVMDGVWAEALGYLGQLEEGREKENEARASWTNLPEGIKGLSGGVIWEQEGLRKSVAKK